MSTGLLDLWVWVDQARVISRGVDTIVEGEPVVTETYGDWFPCRLPPRASRQSFGDKHRTLEDRREMSAKMNLASSTITERDKLEVVELDGSTSVWEIEQVFRPRNGVGDGLLLVMNVVRREES